MSQAKQSVFDAHLSTFQSLQASLISLEEQSNNLLLQSWLLLYPKNKHDCIDDYNQMRLKLESIKRHRASSELLCIHSISHRYLENFRSPIAPGLKPSDEIRQEIEGLTPCIDFAKLLLAEEITTITEGIQKTRSHLNLPKN